MQELKHPKQDKPQKVSHKKSDAQLLDLIKKMNGFKDNQWKQMDKIQVIELVLQDFGNMSVINRFKGIKSLTLINCGISHLQGLQEATKLQTLWVNQNQIQRIEGLEKCTNLKALYLSHNNIKCIEGLDTLISLQTLWICDNKLENIENLDNLCNLKQLWIAGNQIDSIKTSLDQLSNLIDLNISGNRICSFKEVLNLNRLPNLKILAFYDPHFGQNPICNLCNYQTYVLYHLRNITKLDTLSISEEAKAFAESTLMRKKMYYNMRIKTIKRTFSTLTKLIQKAQLIKIDSLNEDLANLFLKINDIGEQTSKIKQLKQIYDLKKEQINHIQQVFDAVNKKLRDTNKSSIRRLQTEFETGGNIRLQEGKPSDKWYVSCVDLIKSRFQAEDLSKFDIGGINIKRVVRIHNRFLKNKFQQKMEMLADITNVNSRKQLEYLFYGLDPNIPSELEHVIQEGFRPAEEAKKLGICPFVPLVNSILGADLPRITNYLDFQKSYNKMDKNFIKKRKFDKMLLLPTGSILICKVLMVKQQIDNNQPFFDPSVPPSELFRKGKVQFSEGYYAVKRTIDTESKHKLWFVMDNNLVIPEYLVEYDYILKDSNQNKVADFWEAVALLESMDDEFISAKNINNYQKQLNTIYNTLVEEISAYQFQSIEQKNSTNLEIQANQLDRFDIGTLKVMLINYFKYCLSRSNAYYDLNENLMFQGTEEFDIAKLKIEDPSVLQFANLSNLKIKELSFMPKFTNIEVLVLSYNNLSNLLELQELAQIKKLDVSHNKITTLSGLSSLPLQHLDISHNQISNIESLDILQLCKSTLKEVNILFNPFQDSEVVKAMISITKKLPNLVWLNHLNRKKFSQLQIEQKTTNIINDEILKENCKIMQSKTLQTANNNDWKLSIESINLTHMKLSSMQGLQYLTNLRQINLQSNLITKIQCIDSCKLLQELNLQNNLITKIQKLDGLVYLKKMQLGKNKISKIQNISTLHNLLQLSLQDNLIDTFQNFPQLRSLMELYIGNNKITDSKQVKNLCNLNKLIILDLSGNPISKEESYRFYVLYLLKKLKVLDGISVESPQHIQARQHFTGRLTEQILKQNLRGHSTEDVVELQLKGCKLKDFDDMFNNKKFPKLAQLDLSGNEFSTVKMLGNLPNLKILILQANKIQTLFHNTDINIAKGLNGCPNLEIIDLSNNLLKDFYGLHLCKLGELKILKASKNQINKIDCLQNLKQLKQLDVNHNKVRQFESNSFQGKLPIKCLKIDDNGLKNFIHVQKLLRLQHLFANSNKITEFYDIQKLAQLPYLKQLQLTGNILYRKPGYRATMIKKLPGLLYLDGREITQQERIEPSSIMNHPQNIPSQLYGQNGGIMNPNQRQMPVRLSSVNFEGVFTSSRLNMESLINQNFYNNQRKP